MNAKHNEGPWSIDEDTRTNMEWNRHIYSADGLCVCFLTHSDGKDTERDKANARLIAAAPDLLEALQLIAAQSIGDDWTAEQAVAFIKQEARAAINKALV